MERVIQGGAFVFQIEPSEIGQPVFEYRVRIWNDSEPQSESADDIDKANEYKQDLDFRASGTTQAVAFDLAYADQSYHIEAFAINDYGESPASNRLDIAAARGTFRVAPPTIIDGFTPLPKREATMANQLHYTRSREVLARAGALGFVAIASARTALHATPLVIYLTRLGRAVNLLNALIGIQPRPALLAGIREVRGIIGAVGLARLGQLGRLALPVTPAGIAAYALFTVAELLITQSFVRAITPSNDGIFLSFTVTGNGYRLPDENAATSLVDIQVRHDGLTSDSWFWFDLSGWRQGLVNPTQPNPGLTTGASNLTITERTYTLFDPIEPRPTVPLSDIKPEFRMGENGLDRAGSHRRPPHRSVPHQDSVLRQQRRAGARMGEFSSGRRPRRQRLGVLAGVPRTRLHSSMGGRGRERPLASGDNDGR